MTTNELILAVAESASKIIASNSDLIQKDILKGAKRTDTEQEVYARMFANTIDLSVQISVQVIMANLIHLGVLNPPDYEKPHEEHSLKLVWDSSKHQHDSCE